MGCRGISFRPRLEGNRNDTSALQTHILSVQRCQVEAAVSASRGARLLAVFQEPDTAIAPKLDQMFRSASDVLAVGDRMKKRAIRCIQSTRAATLLGGQDRQARIRDPGHDCIRDMKGVASAR